MNQTYFPRSSTEYDYEYTLQKLAKQQKLEGPVVWSRISSGLKIQELQPSQYQSVLNILEKDFLDYSMLFKYSKVKEDKVGKKFFYWKLLKNMEDNKSIIALDEFRNNEIAGFLILYAVPRIEYTKKMSLTQLVFGESNQLRTNFTHEIHRHLNIYTDYKCDVFLRYYLMCIRPPYRHNDLGLHLMHAGMDISRYYHIPVVMGIFCNLSTQKIAKAIGMQRVYEKPLESWIDSNGIHVVTDADKKYTCAAMVGVVPQPPPPNVDELLKKSKSERKKRHTKIAHENHEVDKKTKTKPNKENHKTKKKK